MGSSPERGGRGKEKRETGGTSVGHHGERKGCRRGRRCGAPWGARSSLARSSARLASLFVREGRKEKRRKRRERKRRERRKRKKWKNFVNLAISRKMR
jgi:hypothetical protein